MDIGSVYRNQVAPVLSLMHECLGGSPNCTAHPLTGVPSLSRLYNDFLSGPFYSDLLALEATFDANVVRITRYMEVVEAQINTATSFIGWIATKADQVLSLFSIPLTIPLLSIPPRPALLSVRPPNPPDLTAMFREMDAMQAAFEQQIRMPFDQLQLQFDQMTSTLDRLVLQMPGLLDDYRPPDIAFPVDQLQVGMSNNFQAFRSSVSQGLVSMEQAATAKRGLVQPQRSVVMDGVS